MAASISRNQDQHPLHQMDMEIMVVKCLLLAIGGGGGGGAGGTGEDGQPGWC